MPSFASLGDRYSAVEAMVAGQAQIAGAACMELLEVSRPDWWSAVRVIMNTVSEVADKPAVLDDVVRRIVERFSPDKIILFGSRARSDAVPDSDIDLLVLFAEVANPDKRAAELYGSLLDFSRPMDILVSTTSRFERYRNVVNTVYWPASREGKVLYERAT